MVALSDMSFIKMQQTWVDKRGKTRQIPMKVIYPGLSRTGTSSMRVALWELGYEAYHSWSLFENPPDSILWQEAMKAKFEGKGRLYQKADFDSILFDSE
jgi:Sulfotransferase domain